MALILNEEQQSLKDIARDFLEKNAPITHFREIRDTANETGYSQELWKEMSALGRAGILVSEEYGGFDFGMMGMGGMSMGMVSRPFCTTKRKADPDHPSELTCAPPPVLRSRRLSLR